MDFLKGDGREKHAMTDISLDKVVDEVILITVSHRVDSTLV